MIFGQLIIGPPGSGKTTYCKAMCEFLNALGRKTCIINMDPANDVLPYDPAVDLSELITVEDVMEQLHLGPNGALIHCMEYLEIKFDWLLQKLIALDGSYLLFDCPGQVELYTHNRAVHNIFTKLTKNNFLLTAVHLVDSFYCCDPSQFISVLMTSLSTMVQIEMPQINVLSKCDLIEKYDKLQLNLDYYTEVLDLSVLVESLSNNPLFSKFKKLNKAIADTIENYSLVSFLTLSVNNKDCMLRVLKAADKANGYVFGINEEQRNIQTMLSCAMNADFEDAKIGDVCEKYMKSESQASTSGGFVSMGR